MSPLIWLAVGAVLVAVEILAPGFIIFWFGLASLITSFLTFIGLVEAIEYQLFIFFVSSAIFLFLWFGLLRKRFQKESDDDKRDPTLAKLRGKCIAPIGSGRPGEVELYEAYHGLTKWKADSSEMVEIDDEIIVVESSGIKLVVKKFKGE